MNRKIFIFTRYEEDKNNPEFTTVWNICQGRRKKVFIFNSNSDNFHDKLYVIPFYRIRNELQNESDAKELFLKINEYLGEYFLEGNSFCMVHMKNPDLFKEVYHFFTVDYPEIYVCKFSTSGSIWTKWYQEYIKQMAAEAISENNVNSIRQEDFEKLWKYLEYNKLRKEFLDDLRISTPLKDLKKKKYYNRLLKQNIAGLDISVEDYVIQNLNPDKMNADYEKYRKDRDFLNEFLKNEK